MKFKYHELRSCETCALWLWAAHHDAGVVDQYLNDPLVYLGGIRARWGAEFLAAMRAGFRVARARTDAGLLVIHGGDLCQKQNIHDTFNMVDGERI